MTEFDSPTVWLAIVVLSVGTYLLRASFLIGTELFGDLPSSVERVLPFVPVAVLAALIAPYLAYADGALALGPSNEQLVAGIVAFAVARWSENMLLTVGVGMATLWLLQWL